MPNIEKTYFYINKKHYLANSVFFNYPNFNIISQSKGKFFFEDQQQIPTTFNSISHLLLLQ